MDRYHKEECHIERFASVGIRVVTDEGEVAVSFHGEVSDQQIWTILAAINKAYANGVLIGRKAKASELRTAINE